MLQFLDAYDKSPEARQRLLDGLDGHLRAVVHSKGRGTPELVAQAETDVRADPARCLRFDEAGRATVAAGGRVYEGGRFAIPTLGELRTRAAAARSGGQTGRCRLWVLDGASPVTDIGALQATAPPDTLFQVASQFNCLESPGSYVVNVADYFHDPTQGPRASISAFPGTLVRHYAAPASDGSRFVQTTQGRQINLLQDVCGRAAVVRSGYLRAADVSDPRTFGALLEARFAQIRVGLHDGVQVVLGNDWAGAVAGNRTIGQVFTSTIAGGMYGGTDQIDEGICRQLQRAAYLGTLLSAAALGQERAVLTLIGGGVFGNPLPLIWETILWAVDQTQSLLHRDLLVVVNGRNLGEAIPSGELRRAARDRGGALISFDRGGVSVRDE